MISLEELNPHDYPLDEETKENLETLLIRMNKIRAIWGKPMIITSGLRNKEHQLKLIVKGVSKATKSNHLIGAACDVKDADGSLGEWCLENVKTLEEVGLWCEHPKHTKGWVHFQIVPPRSGKRFFIP